MLFLGSLQTFLESAMGQESCSGAALLVPEPANPDRVVEEEGRGLPF